MGQEADPANFDICVGWETAKCHEREDEESYPCDDIKVVDYPLKVNYHPTANGFISLLLE